ncbi:MAG: c-type cytochrome [Gallionellaceae bacterium]
MKPIFISIAATAGLVFAGSAAAVQMPAVGKSRCGACHSIDKKLVGPSFMEVSTKYRGDKEAVSKIAANIARGGTFGWKLGYTSMPPRGMGATDAEIRSLAEFIVGLSK